MSDAVFPPGNAGLALDVRTSYDVEKNDDRLGLLFDSSPFSEGIKTNEYQTKDQIASYRPSTLDNPFRSTGWESLQAGVKRLLLIKRTAWATGRLLADVKHVQRNNEESGNTAILEEPTKSAQSVPGDERPAAMHSVSGEELMHLAADMKKNVRSRMFSFKSFKNWNGSSQLAEGSLNRKSSDEQREKQKKLKVAKLLSKRRKSFPSIARFMFAAHNKKCGVMQVDFDPVPQVPEPSVQDGCIMTAPLPPSERNLACGTYSDDSEQGSEARPMLLSQQVSLHSQMSAQDTLRSTISSLDIQDGGHCAKAQKFYKEIQAAYEGKQCDVQAVERNFASQRADSQPLTFQTLDQIHHALAKALSQANQHTGLTEREMQRLVAAVTSKVVLRCLPLPADQKVLQELSTLQTWLLQHVAAPDHSRGSNRCSHPPPSRAKTKQVDPEIPVHAIHLPDSPFKMFVSELSPASAPPSACSSDSYAPFLALSPLRVHASQQAVHEHHSSEMPPCSEDEPLASPPFRLLTAVQNLKPGGFSDSVRLSHALALLSHACSSDGASLDASEESIGSAPASAPTSDWSLAAGNCVPRSQCVSWAMLQENGSSCHTSCTGEFSGSSAQSMRVQSSSLQRRANEVAAISKLFAPSPVHSRSGIETGKDSIRLSHPNPCPNGILSPHDVMEGVGVGDKRNVGASAHLHVYSGSLTPSGEFILDADSC